MPRAANMELTNRRTSSRLIGPRTKRDVSKDAARMSGTAVPRVVVFSCAANVAAAATSASAFACSAAAACYLLLLLLLLLLLSIPVVQTVNAAAASATAAGDATPSAAIHFE